MFSGEVDLERFFSFAALARTAARADFTFSISDNEDRIAAVALSEVGDACKPFIADCPGGNLLHWLQATHLASVADLGGYSPQAAFRLIYCSSAAQNLAAQSFPHSQGLLRCTKAKDLRSLKI